jgi:hypothetical protein
MNIIESNGNYQIYNSLTLLGELPKGVYAFDCNLRGPFLTKLEDTLKIPEKVYSNDKTFLEHVLHTWNSSDDSLGILLTGKKGLGKSFTANLLCTKLPHLPVIKITREIGKGEGLIDFLNEIKQDHIIYIDEFEKIFTDLDKSDDTRLNQKVFLSFLDGGNNSNIKKLFIITSNTGVNDFFINRPTRLRYVREYEVFDLDVIREVVKDKLKNVEFLEDLLSYVDQDNLNIDILIKVIDEINLHNKPYSEFKDFFNYKISNSIFDVFIHLPNASSHVQIDTLTAHYLNQLKNNTHDSWDFENLVQGNLNYRFFWRQAKNNSIERIDDNNYKLLVTCDVTDTSDETYKVIDSFDITCHIAKRIRHLII